MPRRDLTFRIFVSSTFSDFIRERNALQRVVFPRLREYCRGHGARFPGIEPRFQAIDLRWGVAREAALDQQTMSICIGELHRCQRLSPKPNFIVLIGDRYGWIPLPERIPTGEFEDLMEHFTEEQRRLFVGTDPVAPWRDGQTNARRGWYRRDLNALPGADPPGEYVLQPRTIDLPPDVDANTQRRVQAEEFDDWSGIEREMRLALAAAIENAGWPRDDLRREKYENSATHQEIQHGALSVEGADDHVFCYFRTIDGLPSDQSARGFFDLDEQGRPDPITAERHRQLRRQLGGTDEATGTIPPERCRRYTIEWESLRASIGDPMSGVIDGEDGPVPAPDLQPFCQWVENDLKGIIDRELAAFEGETETAREERLHAEFTQPLTEHFVGREELLSEIEAWCTGNNTTPLVISGVSGSGKTALMAMAGERLAARHPEAVVLARFIGATPGSTELRTLLIGLCQQLDEALGTGGSLPAEISEMRRELETRLSSATRERPVFLLLDALDQLAATDSAHSLWWLPRNLPENARLVVTVLEREDASGEADRVARRMFPDSIVSLRGLDGDEGGRMLDLWLADADRTLQPNQRQVVLDGFERSPWPLYLRTAFDAARRWKSWDEPPPLSRDVPELLANLFERLSRPQNHGELMVRRSLGYLGAARRGLTEDELLDVLSRENKVDPDQTSVLDEFQARSPDSPQTDRLPIVVWSRLYAELESNLTQRQAYGAAVLSFYHRQVGEAVERQFLEEADRLRAHRHLAEYFRSQDYFLESLEEQRARARRLPPTPRPANIRKVDELPWQLLQVAKLSGKDDPKSPHWDAVADQLIDWEFLESAAESGFVFEVVEDLQRGLAQLPLTQWKRVEPVSRVVAAQASWLSQYPQTLRQQCRNYLNATEWKRLQTETEKPVLGDFLTILQEEDSIPRHSKICLVLRSNSGPVLSLAINRNNDRVLSGSAKGRAHYFDAGTGRLLATLDGNGEAIRACALSDDGALALTCSVDGSISVYDSPLGGYARVTLSLPSPCRSCCLDSSGQYGCAGDAQGNLIVFETDSGRVLHQDCHHRPIAWCGLIGRPLRVASVAEEGPLLVAEVADKSQCKRFETPARCIPLNGYVDETTGDIRCAFSNGTAWSWILDSQSVRFVSRTPLPNCRFGALNETMAVFAGSLMKGDRQAGLTAWALPDVELLGATNLPGGCLTSVTMSTDGQYALAGQADGQTALWRLKDWERDPANVAQLAFEGATKVTHKNVVRCAFTAADELLTVGEEGHAALWVPKNLGWSDVAFSLTEEPEADLEAWDDRGQKVPPQWSGVGSADLSADNTQLAVGLYSGQVLLVRFPEGQILVRLKDGGRHVIECSFSLNGKQLVTVHRCGAVNLWELDGTRRELIRIDTSLGCAEIVWDQYTPTILLAPEQGDLLIWREGEPEARTLLRTIDPISACCVSGQTLAWATESGELGVASMTLTHHSHVRRVRPQRTNCCAFSSDARLVATVGSDAALLVHHSRTLDLCGAYPLTAPGSWLAWSDDDERIGVGTRNGDVHCLTIGASQT